MLVHIVRRGQQCPSKLAATIEEAYLDLEKVLQMTIETKLEFVDPLTELSIFLL